MLQSKTNSQDLNLADVQYRAEVIIGVLSEAQSRHPALNGSVEVEVTRTNVRVLPALINSPQLEVQLYDFLSNPQVKWIRGLSDPSHKEGKKGKESGK